jgi:transposase
MHLVYGEARGNDREAQRIYQERYPQLQLSHHTTFASIDRRLREYGSLEINKLTARSPRTVRTPDLEEAVLDTIEEKPSSSTRTIALDLQIHHSTVWRVLKEEKLYPFHLQKVQALTAEDYPRGSAFCRWYINQTVVNPHFAGSVLVADEATFTQDGIFNCHNMHMWKQENRATSVRAHQQRFSLNVWCGLLHDFVFGPNVLPNRLTGEATLIFWSTPCHSCWRRFLSGSARACGTCMMEPPPTSVSRCAIIRTMPVAWPARSPDLNQFDFFVWGHLKTLV